MKYSTSGFTSPYLFPSNFKFPAQTILQFARVKARNAMKYAKLLK